jgi:hypothetical protein
MALIPVDGDSLFEADNRLSALTGRIEEDKSRHPSLKPT